MLSSALEHVGGPSIIGLSPLHYLCLLAGMALIGILIATRRKK